MHADNAYYLPDVRIVSHRCKTNTQSNTAFRGFGGPQGMMAIEYVLDEIARALDLDPLAVRRVNFYGARARRHALRHAGRGLRRRPPLRRARDVLGLRGAARGDSQRGTRRARS